MSDVHWFDDRDAWEAEARAQNCELYRVTTGAGGQTMFNAIVKGTKDQIGLWNETGRKGYMPWPADSVKKPDEKPDRSSSAPSPLPKPVPMSSLVDVINRNSQALENLALVISMLMETLDPDGLRGDEDEADLDRPQYLNSRPGRG